MTKAFEVMLQSMDSRVARFDQLDRYYAGQQPLAFMAPEARRALGDRLGRIASNIPRLAVTALSERLRVTGFEAGEFSAQLWDEWIRNDLDQLAPVVHREALTLGTSFVLVWAGDDGQPTVSVESARQMVVERDPVTREVVQAVKRWTVDNKSHVVVFTPEKVHRMVAHGQNATTGYQTTETVDNPLGVVPVVPFVNSGRLLGEGHSELDDLMPLVDALNKSLADMMVASEYVGRPRRWATGIELEEDEDGNVVNPIPEGPRAMVSESADTKFGQLEAADLGSYEASVRIILGQIMAVSALPSHYIGITSSNPASADALRASEASLTARAEERQAQFGRAWEQVAKLILAVLRGQGAGAFRVDIRWADAATRSTAQEADAVVKLVQAGIIPPTTALERLGYSAEEITRIRENRRLEAFDTAMTAPGREQA